MIGVLQVSKAFGTAAGLNRKIVSLSSPNSSQTHIKHLTAGRTLCIQGFVLSDSCDGFT